MITTYNSDLKRRMAAPERVLLMMPLNVVMAAKIKGAVEVEQLAAVLDSLRKRHALLAVRVVIDENDMAWYVTEGVPEFTINTIPLQTEDQWQQTAVEECKTSFPIETGPLVRFSLLHSSDGADLVVCAHHAICDGMSLTYLIRDILQQLAEPGRAVEILPEPPAITSDTVPSPPSANFIAKGVMGLFNKQWARQNISFSSDDHETTPPNILGEEPGCGPVGLGIICGRDQGSGFALPGGKCHGKRSPLDSISGGPIRGSRRYGALSRQCWPGCEFKR